ncbi:MAG: secondary thiamine-phosphate synthase enzyme YjbQ [bacterium]|nr:secondary thiamine-phosphate synthase enzyme YjbQ [bacterium]
MLIKLDVSTRQRIELVDITAEVKRVVKTSGVREGVCHLFCPHTTAGLTINENADPSVKTDLAAELSRIVPYSDNYFHLEGNSDAHIKASLIGASETVFVENGDLVLGTWQGIIFCEFDGPRQRKIWIKI